MFENLMGQVVYVHVSCCAETSVYYQGVLAAENEDYILLTSAEIYSPLNLHIAYDNYGKLYISKKQLISIGLK